jgi:hypothetical protein
LEIFGRFGEEGLRDRESSGVFRFSFIENHGHDFAEIGNPEEVVSMRCN